MKTMSLMILLLTLALSSCKGAKSKNDEAVQQDQGAPKERIYTASELEIGRRICGALKSKREFFETLTDMKEKFRLRGELRNCENPNPYNSAEFTATISNASSSAIEYQASNRPNYFKDVVTDQSTAMNILCTNLSVSNSVSNTNLSGSSYFVINLLIANSFDRVEIYKRTKDGSGNYPLVSIEGINVFTQTNQVPAKFLGVEQERIRYTPCAGSKNSSYVKQTWVSAITDF